MKTTYSKAIIAAMAATLGLTAIAPAMAQTAAPTATAETSQPAPNAFRGHHHGPENRNGFGGFLDFERGAEAIEVALVRIGHRLELTGEQQTLLDSLKSDALAAAETFASTTKGLRPEPGSPGQQAEQPDFSQRLTTKIALDSARLAALESIQPAATAFFDSLSDEQKAQIAPQRGERGEHGPGKRGDTNTGGPREHGRGEHTPNRAPDRR